MTALTSQSPPGTQGSAAIAPSEIRDPFRLVKVRLAQAGDAAARYRNRYGRWWTREKYSMEVPQQERIQGDVAARTVQGIPRASYSWMGWYKSARVGAPP